MNAIQSAGHGYNPIYENQHTDEPDWCYAMRRDLIDEIARLTAKLAASQERERVLREAIEKAPHEGWCALLRRGYVTAKVNDAGQIVGFDEPQLTACNCWKRAALGEEG